MKWEVEFRHNYRLIRAFVSWITEILAWAMGIRRFNGRVRKLKNGVKKVMAMVPWELY